MIDAQGIVIGASAHVRTDDEICQFVGLGQGGGAVIAVDAPLIVRNRDKCRPVEKRLTEMFWPYDAGPYPANLDNPAFQEGGRIPRFVNVLEGKGFVQRIHAAKQEEQQTLIEVFPSPAQVVLFPGQNRRQHIHCTGLRYKPKQGRSWAEVHSQWEIYRARLRSLEYGNPPLKLSPEVKKQIGIDITEYEGTRYKQFDDLLDGIFCAYLAYYFWYWGSDRSWTLGDLEHGCVLLPRCHLPDCPLADSLT